MTLRRIRLKAYMLGLGKVSLNLVPKRIVNTLMEHSLKKTRAFKGKTVNGQFYVAELVEVEVL